MEPFCCWIENGKSCEMPPGYTVITPGDGWWYDRYYTACASHAVLLADGGEIIEGLDV